MIPMERNVLRAVQTVALVLLLSPLTGRAQAIDLTQAGPALEVPVGQSIVLEMNDDVSTVSIADPKVADAAVGSARTVVVNGKSRGVTSLVVWEEGGRHTLYRVSATDANSSRQVLLQCKVAELNEQRLSEFGLDWIATGSSAKLDGILSGGLFVTKVESPFNPLLLGPTTDAFSVYSKADGSLTLMGTLRAMEQKGAARTLASPNLVALSGDSASFLAGGEFPVPIAKSANETGFTITIEWKQFGVKLAFVPTVLDSNRIRLFVAPEVSAPDQTYAVLLNGYIVPGLVTRRISTTVEMKDGEVLVIGGVKQREVIKKTSKFPILGDIPLISLLFKHTKTETLDRDLVIVVSPQIVRQLARTFPKNLPGEERQGGQR
ncbi:MAG TPA: pilus assembly protein N-terminal domain-containing protein [Candidatus Limnocylindrales bacterium]|nr:pilus assembly protein N-terminal domain-containing protein [Candidatus Limnocylindrales bacterium]